MVRAILDGTKTQTRRIVKVRGLDFIGGKGQENDPSAWGYPYTDREGYADLTDGIPCPYGKPGDHLWVRETHRFQTWEHIEYRADGATHRVQDNDEWLREKDISTKWRPSLFMPRWASRITLEVESVRVERLQAISEEDAWAEGIEVKFCEAGKPCTCESNPVGEYRDLWESINGTGSWDENPFVWVVTFRRIKP